MTTAVKRPNVNELLQHAELRGVQFLQVAGRLKENATDEDTAETDVRIQVAESREDDRIEVRFLVTVSHQKAEFVVEVATRYSYDQPLDVSDEVVREFIEKVAIMAAYPFVREGVATTSARLELDPPILGLLRQGEFQLGEPSGSSPGI